MLARSYAWVPGKGRLDGHSLETQPGPIETLCRQRGGATPLMFSPPAFPQWPGLHAWFVRMAPEGLGVGMATNRAIQRGAGLEGARFFGENDGGIAERLLLLKQLQYIMKSVMISSVV